MAHKSGRKKPKVEMSPEEQAASLVLLRQTKSLSTPRGDDIATRFEVDLSLRYKRLIQEIKAYTWAINIGEASRIHSSVHKAVPKPPRKMNARVLLTRESVRLAAEILGEVVRRCAQRHNDGSGLEGVLRGLEHRAFQRWYSASTN
jgi:hypothetical protein